MKKLILIVFIALITCSCNNKKVNNPENLQTARNIEIVKSMFDAFNRYDWEVMANYFADPLIVLDPSYGQDYVQKANSELVSKYSKFPEWSPDIQDSIVAIYAHENSVIAEFISYGTTQNGEKWKLPICTVFHFKDGEIIRDATYYDN